MLLASPHPHGMLFCLELDYNEATTQVCISSDRGWGQGDRPEQPEGDRVAQRVQKRLHRVRPAAGDQVQTGCERT